MRVGRLDFGNLVNVLEANRAYEVVSGAAGALLYAGRLLEEVSGRGRFGYEGESAVGLDSDQCRNGDAGLYVARARVEFFAEIHRLYAAGTESRADRGRGSCLASRDEETLWKTHADKERNQQKVSGTHNYLSFSVESGL